MNIEANHFIDKQWRVSITNHPLAVTDKKHVAMTGQYPGSNVGFITRVDKDGVDIDLNEVEREKIVAWVIEWQKENEKKRNAPKPAPKPSPQPEPKA
jgi:hypothetical protein